MTGSECCFRQFHQLILGKNHVSSLRIETLRLCWLEVFIDVAESENISATARNLGLDQSTVSRYLKAVQDWLGLTLVTPAKCMIPTILGRPWALPRKDFASAILRKI
ncbi:LysR family transcriptional regulator [Novosphingobium sp. MMS21-SN21R]|uniref:helix-turn-helix domain-containing protein n=1 Tax=Novosphingobium sp. MMS21-SN21R TaxID=2969298 RepID=UPI003904DFD3